MAVVAMLMATVACSDDDEQTTNGTPTYDSGVLAVQELGTDTYRPLQLTNAVAYSDYLTSKGIDQYQWQTLLNGSLNAMMTRRVYWLDSLFHEQHGSPRLVFRHWHKINPIDPRCKLLYPTEPIMKGLPIAESHCTFINILPLKLRIVLKILTPYRIITIHPSYYKIYFVIHSQKEYKYNLNVNLLPFPSLREHKTAGIEGYISPNL